MAQYHAGRNEFVDRNNELYDVVLLGNEVGGIMTNRYAQDAWGRPKSVQDFSLFSGTWTHSVPARVWEEINYDLVTPANNTAKPQMVNATSKHGMLSVTSGTTPNAGTVLRSKKYVRYQPNRGQLYSTAITCPNPTGKGFRTWGLGTARDGFYFGMFGTGSDWDIKVSRWRDGANQENHSIKDLILELNPNFDPEKGHVYDIQFEWRGVGNIYFFVDLQLVYTMELLGTLDYLSVTDPALGVAFSVAYQGDGVDDPELELLSGCVDVTSEGGTDEKTLFGSLSSGDDFSSLGAANVPTAVCAIKVPRMIDYNGDTVFNSRGVVMDKLATFCASADTLTSVWITRDVAGTNLDGLTWGDVPDSNIQHLDGATAASALNTAFQADKTAGVMMQVFSEFSAKDSKTEIVNPSENSEFALTPGDILVICGAGLQNTGQSYATTVYYSEQL